MREVSLGEAARRWSRPERVVLAVSVDDEGTPDIIALGWKMNTSGRPPMIAISIGHGRYSLPLISKANEFVLAVPGEDLADEVLFCGTRSGRKVDKFKETGLTPMPGKFVRAPLIKECVANVECRLVGTLDTGDHTIFVGEILAAWASDDERRNLLSVGEESGYEQVGGGHGYRFGVIKR